MQYAKMVDLIEEAEIEPVRRRPSLSTTSWLKPLKRGFLIKTSARSPMWRSMPFVWPSRKALASASTTRRLVYEPFTSSTLWTDAGKLPERGW